LPTVAAFPAQRQTEPSVAVGRVLSSDTGLTT